MKIPQQLVNMRFNRVRFKEKRAFENGWQNNPYNYEQIHNYFPKENYGVICGKEVRVLDDDTKDGKLISIFLKNFGDTFRVRDHLYIYFNNGFADKIIFYDPVTGEHMGELQGEGTYVVGPGSIHPSGAIYDIRNNLNIKEIDYDLFKQVFNDYFKKKRARRITMVSSSFDGDDVKNIKISSIISGCQLKDVGNGCLQGPHPKHGSKDGDEGMNFRVDTSSNTWYCFRCQCGGGPAELIAVMEGIAECYEIGPNCFSSEQGKEIIKVAREKYGLSTPEPKEKDLGEVKGYANSVSIIKLAERRNFTNCPKCGNKFIFTDSHGLYWCDTCKTGGGLNRFTELISWRKE